MKTLYVGSNHFFNRFDSLEAAVERAQDDDVIELCKDERDVSLHIDKNITINGHGHLITPADGKTALDCLVYVTLYNIRFDCKPRTNAIILRNGGNLSKIRTNIIGPARALYPTIVQRGGALNLSDSDIMYMETYEGHGGNKTVTTIHNSYLMDYYGGSAYLDDGDYSLSKFRNKTHIFDSVIECTLLEGECKLSSVVLKNFNKATGNVVLDSCELKASKSPAINREGEPVDGPLKNLKPDVIPYALHIAGGRVTVDGFSTDMGNDCIGFYMTGGSMDIRSVQNHNSRVRHLLKNGSVVFNNVMDDGFYEIRKARCGIIQSKVNTSSEIKPALEELDSMIGLYSVKCQIRTMINTIRMNMEHPEKDFGFSHHMIFAGDPGTGKTTAAKLVAQSLFEIGAIPENKCLEMPANQLVKGFVGQTGGHVESVMQKALGGVLFIDEAYELMVKDNQNTFNNDALAVLLRYMEDHRHELVVIAAGYEKEMKEFLASNVGLTRRFQWISFENYTIEEMTEIFMSMCRKYNEDFDMEDPRDSITHCFDVLTKFYLSHPDAKGRVTNGGNGGLVRNLLQQIIFSRNNRVAAYPESTIKITKADITEGLKEEMKKAMNVQYGIGSAVK